MFYCWQYCPDYNNNLLYDVIELEFIMDIHKELIEKILKNDINGVREILSQNELKPDVCDEHGMTPLQHAAYKGNKEVVRLLLDQGADVNSGKHEYGYTALHFAALSGNTDACQLLLEHGAKTYATNSVGRTPAQMAAFVGNHACVTVINNFVPKSDIDYYTVPNGLETEPKIPPVVSAPLYKLIMHVNLNPVKIAINLMRSPILCENLEKIKNVLELMSHKEMRRGLETNEIMSFKFHYLSSILGEIINSDNPEYLSKNASPMVVSLTCLDDSRQELQHMLEEHFKVVSQHHGFKTEAFWSVRHSKRCRKSLEQENKDPDQEPSKKVTAPIELFIKKMLKVNKDGIPEYQESFLKETVRKFPNTECTILRQMVCSLSRGDSPMALSVITSTINGQRGFTDTDVPTCATCGEENAPKKCSQCKSVQYCDKDCQKFHWFIHKKFCTSSGKDKNNKAANEKSKQEAVNMATEQLMSDIKNLKT